MQRLQDATYSTNRTINENGLHELIFQFVIISLLIAYILQYNRAEQNTRRVLKVFNQRTDSPKHNNAGSISPTNQKAKNILLLKTKIFKKTEIKNSEHP